MIENAKAMGAIRRSLIQRFPPSTRRPRPGQELEDALHWHLRIALPIDVDGWTVFRVVHESDDHLAAVGLMALLEGGSVPITVDVKAQPDGLEWSAQVALVGDEWRAMPESKRWKIFYLYAGGELQEPKWTWGPPYEGILRHADA